MHDTLICALNFAYLCFSSSFKAVRAMKLLLLVGFAIDPNTLPMKPVVASVASDPVLPADQMTLLTDVIVLKIVLHRLSLLGVWGHVEGGGHSSSTFGKVGARGLINCVLLRISISSIRRRIR